MELANTDIYVTAINPSDRYKLFEIASIWYICKEYGTLHVKTNIRSRTNRKVDAHEKREVNLPKWMGIGPKLYALFPGLFERSR